MGDRIEPESMERSGRRAVRGRRAPTVRDVARAAGVSTAVVSYAFNRPERVAATTRERVLAAAAALGYAGPDAAARALRLGRYGAIGLVGPGSIEALLADPAATLVARGLARTCDRAGIALLLAGGPGGSVDGTVVLGDARGWNGRGPAVAVGGPARDGLPCVIARVREGAAQAARHLAQVGHPRLAVVGPPGESERLEGASEGWGATGSLLRYEAAGPARADGEVAARAALAARPRPTALLALTHRLALGALDAARGLGLEVPRDLSVAGMDDLPGTEATPLTSVFVPYLPMGELAGTLLAAVLAGRALPPAPPLPTSLAIRITTAPPSPE
jgi:DNA-binding LacI/PurR family transcriptional regulator